MTKDQYIRLLENRVLELQAIAEKQQALIEKLDSSVSTIYLNEEDLFFEDPNHVVRATIFELDD